jgi:hypothetical protein
MPQPTSAPDQDRPTLWPQSLKDEARIRLALESAQSENRRLKDLVVRLSEMILRNILDNEARPPPNAPGSHKSIDHMQR